MDDKSRRPHSVLVVDDNLIDRVLLMEAFTAANSTNPLTFLKTGQELLDYFYLEDVPLGRMPGLIILDLCIPDIHGLDLLKRIRSEPITRRIPVVILSGVAKAQDIHDCYLAGANSFISKNDSLHGTEEKIACLIKYWFEHCRLPRH